MEELIKNLKSTDFFVKRAAVIEVAKLENLSRDDIKKIFSLLKDIEKENDKALNFFLKKAFKNLEKIEKLYLINDSSDHNPELEKMKLSLDDPESIIRKNALQSLKVMDAPIEKKIEILENFAEKAVEDEAILAIEIIESFSEKSNILQEEDSNKDKSEEKTKDKVLKEDSGIKDVNAIQTETYGRESKAPPFSSFFIAILLLIATLVITSYKTGWPLPLNKKADEALLKSRVKMFVFALNKKDKSFIEKSYNFDVKKSYRLAIKKVFCFKKNAVVIYMNDENSIFIQKWKVKNSNWYPDSKLERI